MWTISGRMMLLLAPGALAALGLAATASAAERPYHVRGTLTTVAGDQLAVETDAEEMVEVGLSDDTRVLVVTPASLEEVGKGDYVGITSIESGGRRVAIGMHIFAEELRGAAEGHSEWDLVEQPNTMTNATVAEVEEVDQDRRLTLTYEQEDGGQTSEGSQTITVPPDLEIVRLGKAADRSVLEPGRTVFLIVQDGQGGQPTALAAIVGSEGATPPM